MFVPPIVATIALIMSSQVGTFTCGIPLLANRASYPFPRWIIHRFEVQCSCNSLAMALARSCGFNAGMFVVDMPLMGCGLVDELSYSGGSSITKFSSNCMALAIISSQLEIPLVTRLYKKSSCLRPWINLSNSWSS